MADSNADHERKLALMALAEMIDDLLNKGVPQHYGFSLLVYPIGRDGDADYMSNGMNPAQTVAMLTDMMERERNASLAAVPMKGSA